MRRKREIFILWVRSDLSRVVVPVLDLELRRHGLKVAMDRILKTSNRASLAQWMANNIENFVVICVVTPELTELFNCDEDAPSQEHLGGQWEIRLVIQRLYEHGMGDGCPVIPVLPPGVNAEDGPMILRGLENTRFNHVTGEGIDTIVKRVHQAYDHSERAMHGQPEDRTLAATQPWDGLTESVRQVDPHLPQAHDIGKAWVKRAFRKGASHSSDLLPVFRRIRLAALVAGDLALLEQMTDICLKAMAHLDLDDESRVEKCTYLLNKAFLLFCDHKVELAKETAEQAYGLARTANDAASMARAKRCLALIRIRLAAFKSGDARTEEVEQACEYAVSAMNHFRSTDSEDEHLAAFAMAEVRFAEYMYKGDKRSLREAARLSAEAAKGFSGQKFHWFDEARLLQSAVAFEQRAISDTTKLLDETLLDLRSRAERAEAFTELLGRGHLLRARIRVWRGRSDDAQVEIGNARAIFDKLNLQHMIAECEWLSFSCDRKRRRFTAYDISALERVCPEPAFRLKVALRGRTWSAIGGLLWGRIGDKYWKRAAQETQAAEFQAR